MIQVKKTRKSKNRLAIIVTSSVLIPLIAGMCVIWYFINKTSAPTDDGSNSPSTDFYPDVDTKDITGFEVIFPESETDDSKQSFGAVLDGGTYYFFYYDDSGERVLYKPAINYEEPGFDYSSLYAATSDGMKVPKISYILYALANTSYNSKIKIPDLVEEEREEQLSTYGLDKDSRKTLTFTYLKKIKNDEGKEEEKTFSATVYIGNKLITGIGYYLMVSYPDIDEYKDERETQEDYVYISQGAENYSHALDGFFAFVAPNLIMGGNLNNNDSATNPQLTPAYRQWKSIVYDKSSDKVKEKTKVIITTDIYTAAYAVLADGIGSVSIGEDGYASTKNEQTTVDLEYIASNDIYTKFIAALVGKSVGNYGNNKITPIVIVDQNEASIGKTYKYTIHEIESVIDENGIEKKFGAVGQNNLIKVRYSCEIDGVDVVYEGAAKDKLHAVIDLTDILIPSEVRNRLQTLSVGESFEPLTFEIVYTSDNTTSATFEFRINRISHIIDSETGFQTDKISEKTIVNFVYQVLHNGTVTSEDTMSLDLSASTENADALTIALKEALLGAKMEENGVYEKDIKAYTSIVYYQSFKNFISYEISSIDYFVASEEVVSFRYANSSERDPFYGEAIHINTLQNHKYSSYALDWKSCDRVIKILSGTLAGTSSTVFEGLKGEQVVAVGLTPQNMEKYGLYAYTVYYEIPRYIEDVSVGDEPSEYTWWDSVGFTLYISETNIDGKRYVGSDLYDIIVEIDGETFDFVEKEFVDFWARRDIFMVEQTYINNLKAEFNLEGFKGKYSFTVEHPTMWIVNYIDGTTSLLGKEPADDAEGVKEKSEYQATYVYVDALDAEGVTQTLLLERLREQGPFKDKDGIHIHAIYDYLYTNGLSQDKQTVGYDYLGDSCFKDLLYILYGTGYLGTVNESDALDAKSRGAVMSLSMNVEGSKVDNIYNFYYTSDGRVAVEIDDGVRQTCFFYITNHSFKMVVSAFMNLLNGKTIDFSGSYVN